MLDRVVATEGAPRDGVYVLRGLLLCGLIVTAGSGQSSLHESIRTALPLLGGLGFGTALGEVQDTDWSFALRWTLHLAAMWLVTLSPAMWGHREVTRTCAVAGILVILFRSGRRAPRPWIAAGALITVATVVSLQSAWSHLGLRDVEYGLGIAWPRGWAGVGRDATLFFFGCWAAGGKGIRRIAAWRGLAHGLRSLGRMPLTTAIGQSLLAWVLIWAGRPDRMVPWLHPGIVDGMLLTQIAFSWWWLSKRQAGPCEHLLGRARAHLGRLPSAAWTVMWSRGS